MPTFEPPVVQDLPMVITDPVTARQNPLHNRLFRHYSPAHRGRSVLKLKAADGSYTYTTVDYPTTDQIDAAPAHWLGGHVYEVDDTEGYYLAAYGYNVRPVPPIAPPGLGGYTDVYTAEYQ